MVLLFAWVYAEKTDAVGALMHSLSLEGFTLDITTQSDKAWRKSRGVTGVIWYMLLRLQELFFWYGRFHKGTRSDWRKSHFFLAHQSLAFEPPLTVENEVSARFVEMRHRAYQPKIRYLLKPLSFIPFTLLVTIGLVLVFPAGSMAPLDAFFYTLLGVNGMKVVLYTALVFHFFQGILAMINAMALRMPWTTALGWFLLTLLGGNGALKRVTQLRKMVFATAKEKRKRQIAANNAKKGQPDAAMAPKRESHAQSSTNKHMATMSKEKTQ